MELFTVFLVIHIIAGTIGLIAGSINIIRKKGDKGHRLVGLFFSYGMLLVGLSANIMSVLHPSYFLFIVSVFTIYMSATGMRYLKLRKLSDSQSPKIIDWALTGIMLVFGLAFIGFGGFNLFKGNYFGVVFITFGALGMLMVWQDFTNYRGKSSIKNIWLVMHLQRMIGAYIAAMTAFLVVNNEVLPGVIAWLLPTVVLTPLIIKWSKKYEVKIKKETN